MSTSPHNRPANRLAEQASPYLLQHAHNPVDWYPWGQEAFDAARAQNKPIFLSVGYSTCYWCHVMERESFENEQIAEEMNRRFINIKVDREERPDVDQLYMMAVQILRQQGGWPMSVWLTPDLRPFEAGTYFPPTDAHGRPGFPTILRAIDEAWHNRRDAVEDRASKITEILHDLAEPPASPQAIRVDKDLIDQLIERSTSDYDARLGGFGGAPKFPRQTQLEMLLTYAANYSPAHDPGHQREHLKERALNMALHSLAAMAAGGIRDHLGGAFHRYATDAQWLVPHFEIMLYDNAMLAWLYTEAYRQTEQRQFAAVARGIFDFVLHYMTSPQGAFYTGIDAETDAREGATYLWTPQQVEQVLGAEDARIFNHVYGLDLGPNFADPHHGIGQPDRNVLYLPKTTTDAAKDLGLSLEQLQERLEPMRRKLLDVRLERKQPQLDTKMITSWNALMIRALAHAGDVLAERQYIDSAQRCADFLLSQHLRDNGSLWRSIRDGKASHEGFLDDYAYLAQALLALRIGGGSVDRKQEAQLIATALSNRFEDRDNGGYFFSAADQADLIVRQKVGTDSPLPAGNAVAAMVELELGNNSSARRTLEIFVPSLTSSPEGMSAMLQACIEYVRYAKALEVEPRAATERPLSPEQLASGVVSVDAAWTTPAELRLRIHIASGFHLNAHAANQNMIATQLHLDAAVQVEVDSIDYPPGEERSFAFSDEPLRVYEGDVDAVIRFKGPMTGQAPLVLALSYQACTEDACLPSTTRRFEVPRP